MDFTTLSLFVDVCECGSIAKAATRNFISRQALAKTMDRLEEEVGVALLVRTRSGIAVTDSGKYLLKSAQKAIADWNKTTSRVKALAAGRKTLRIGCQMAMMGDEVLRALLFDDEMPGGVNLVFINVPKTQCWSMLHAGELDLAYTLAPQNDAEIIEEPIECPFSGAYLLMGKHSPLAQRKTINADSLRGQRVLVLNDPAKSNSHLIGYLNKAKSDILFMPSTNSLLRQLVAEGKGVLVVPGSAICQFRTLDICARPIVDFPPIMWQSLLRLRGCSAETMLVAKRIAQILESQQASPR